MKVSNGGERSFQRLLPKKRLEAHSENSTPNRTDHLRYTELGLCAIKK
jgi:hypothetical protein